MPDEDPSAEAGALQRGGLLIGGEHPRVDDAYVCSWKRPGGVGGGAAEGMNCGMGILIGLPEKGLKLVIGQEAVLVIGLG